LEADNTLFSRFPCSGKEYLGYPKDMAQVVVEIPDELSEILGATGGNLSRAVLEAVAIEAYRERKLSTAQLQRLLGFENRYELDGFLKSHEVWLDYTAEDLDRDRAAHRKLGL
jgi:hypothetical protein